MMRSLPLCLYLKNPPWTVSICRMLLYSSFQSITSNTISEISTATTRPQCSETASENTSVYFSNVGSVEFLREE